MAKHNQMFGCQVTNLKFDDRLISVTPQPLPNNQGFSLEITPKLENVPPGGRHQTALTFETDLTPGEQYEVQVHVLNSAETTAPSLRNDNGSKADSKTGEDDDDEELDEEEEDKPAGKK